MTVLRIDSFAHLRTKLIAYAESTDRFPFSFRFFSVFFFKSPKTFEMGTGNGYGIERDLRHMERRYAYRAVRTGFLRNMKNGGGLSQMAIEIHYLHPP